MRPWFVLVGCLGLIGCGGASSHPAGDAPPVGDASFLAHGDASSSPAPGHDAGGVGTGEDSGGSGPAYATPYFPLAIGLSWTWSGCADGGGVTSTVTAESTDAGVSSYTVTNPPGCYFASLGYDVFAGDGGETDVDVDTGSGTYLQYVFPPSQGATWGAGGASGATYTWDMHYDSYTVPAGAFSDCWRRTNAYGSEIYCHDVGMVWLTSSGSTYELLGKSF